MRLGVLPFFFYSECKTLLAVIPCEGHFLRRKLFYLNRKHIKVHDFTFLQKVQYNVTNNFMEAMHLRAKSA